MERLGPRIGDKQHQRPSENGKPIPDVEKKKNEKENNARRRRPSGRVNQPIRLLPLRKKRPHAIGRIAYR
jgi:hypothetical protein